MTVLADNKADPSSHPGGGRPPARPFRADIDGLRAVAILLVVAYHIDLRGVSGGFVGVDVFFVISGYLITRNLLVESERVGGVALLAFWGRRIRRLVPAMFLMVTATLVGASVVLPAVRMPDVVEQGGAASLYLSNVLFANELGDYFASDIRNSPFLHTWSLGVEEQFYIVWPVLVGLVAWSLRRRRTWLRPALGLLFTAVLVPSLVVSLRLTDEASPWAFYGLHSRAWEFAVAGLLAVIALPRVFERALVRQVSSVVGLALILGAAVTLDGSTPYPGRWALLPVVGTVLLVLAGSTGEDRPAAVVSGLATSPAQWFGRVSYSWYLWHWPFIILMAARYGDHAWVKPAAAGVSLLVAAAGYRLVENPVRFSPWLTTSAGRTLALGAALTVAALLVGVGVEGAAERDLSTALASADDPTAEPPSLDTMMAVAAADRGARACVSQPATPSGIEYCLAGQVGGDAPTVLVLGDSHAYQWSVTLHQVGVAEGFRIAGYWRGACPPHDVMLLPGDGGQSIVDECYAHRDATPQLLDEIRPDAVIVSNALLYRHRLLDDDGHELPMEDRAPLWEARYRALLESLLERGIGVGVIRDNPHLPFDPIDCLTEEQDVDACALPRDEALRVTAEFRAAEDRVLADHPEIPQLSSTDLLCGPERCRIGNDRYLYYWDAQHLTTAFTGSQAEELGDLIHRTLD